MTNPESDEVDALYGRLRSSKQGDLTHDEISEVIPALARCWHKFDGSSETNMDGSKLSRVETMTWIDPKLTLQIERHGAIVGGGSTRAEVQGWWLDFVKREAKVGTVSRRQVYPMDQRFDVRLAAEEIAAIITENRDDERVIHKGNGIRVVTGKVIPKTNAQTTAGRRKRFADELARLLVEHGWNRERRGSHLIFRRS
jgi:hypothetical protein